MILFLHQINDKNYIKKEKEIYRIKVIRWICVWTLNYSKTLKDIFETIRKTWKSSYINKLLMWYDFQFHKAERGLYLLKSKRYTAIYKT